MIYKTDYGQIITLVLITIVLTFLLAFFEVALEGKLPSQREKPIEIVYLTRNDSTGFLLLDIKRPKDFSSRVFLYNSEGVELVDFDFDSRGTTYSGTLKTSDSTRMAIPKERISEFWDSIEVSYKQGGSFSFKP